ncbi:MAG: HIRAN domain-containing protein [Rhodocyclales bacterium]|nr:HIRAN domain-containing protein [Rhodocyclales bacterium]
MPSMRHRLLALCCAACLTLPAQAETIKVLVQSSPLAGFQFYAGRDLWDDMKAGDALVLAREPENAHDANAVRVEWRGRKLGYLPRAENRAVAAEMDRGGKVTARIARLNRHLDPWKRIQVEVYVVL